MNKLFTMMMFATAAGTVFTSCSKDDDQAPEKTAKHEVAGIWTLTDVKQRAEGEYTKANGETGFTIEFKADGTFSATVFPLGTFGEGVKYAYDGEDTITIKENNPEFEWEVTTTITIVSLKDGAFEVEIKSKGVDPMDPDYEMKAWYKGTKK